MTKKEIWDFIIEESKPQEFCNDTSIYSNKTCDVCGKKHTNCLEIISDIGDCYENQGERFWICKDCFLKGEQDE